MSSTALQQLTSEEYLTLEREAEFKHEFYGGQVFAMAGTTNAHNAICVNLIRAIGTALKGSPCQPFAMDMRVKVSEAGLYTYPDVAIVCGEPIFEDNQLDTLLNPKVIFEVLSPSTEKYDRGRKFAMYQALESLEDYILVSQDIPRVEHFEREDVGHWRLSVYASLSNVLDLRSVGAQFPLAEVYDRVSFGPPPPLREPTE